MYHYDQTGQLLMETTDTGIPLRTYIWLDQTPLAQIDLTPTGLNLLYLHTDHLNTPRAASNAAGTVVWRWAGESFGSTAAFEDPDGDAILTVINLRFPGQYFDAETGFFYNWNRYYDPRLGRYISHDRLSVSNHALQYFARMRTTLNKLDPVVLGPEVFSSSRALSGVPLELDPYLYVGANPLRWIDPTGEASWVEGVIIGIGVGVGFYCYKKGIETCQKAYPNHADIMHPDRQKFLKCISSVTGVIALGIGWTTDPIKSAATEAGAQSCGDQCNQ